MESQNLNDQNLKFDEVMKLVQHIGEEERHFNSLELEYRKLASQWLLVTFAAIGFIFTQQKNLPFNAWIIVAALCVASTVGIFVIWMLDIKVYHELLHSAFKQGVKLELKYPQFLPPMRILMVKSQTGGDIIKRVKYFYFYSILVLLLLLNISVYFIFSELFIGWAINGLSIAVIAYLFYNMNASSDRDIAKLVESYTEQ